MLYEMMEVDIMNKEIKQNYNLRAMEMVNSMTLTEKVSQLRNHSKALPKHGIHEYNWWNECLHGVARAGLATVFPQAIAMAATFSDEILFRVGDIISTEARAKHHEFIRQRSRKMYQGLNFWSPNINIYRDPRWGRGHESYGECPVLTSKLGVAFIKGLQGDDEKFLKTCACSKHFAVHSGPESERHSIDVSVSKKDLAETYLYAFKSSVIDADVEAIMTAYNMVNGESCCASKSLLVDTLRGEWGFEGHVVSDCGGLFDIMLKHKVTYNPLKAVALAINNGLDLECGQFYAILPIAVKRGYVSESTIDKALSRLLSAKIKMGMFDDDCKYNKIPYSENCKKEHEDYAIDVASKSIVLLKNDGVLPITDKDVKIGLFGHNATNELAYLGNYFGTPSSFETLFDGVARRAKDNIVYAEGFGLAGLTKKGGKTEYINALEKASSCDYVIVATGLDSSLEGEAGDAGAGAEGIVGKQGDRESIALPNIQTQFIDDLAKSGKKVIVVNFSGGAVSFAPIENHVSAIVQVWYPGAKGGEAIARILFGEVNPSGKLPLTFYADDKDLGDFYDYSMTNRTYRYFEGKPAYPFGYGLSYTSFDYKDMTVDVNDDSVIINTTVTNTGDVDGDDVVQVYMDYKGDKTQPKIKLLATKRVAIKVGERAKVSISIKKEQLLGFNTEGHQVVVKGEYGVYIGGGQPKYSECLMTVIDEEILINNSN